MPPRIASRVASRIAYWTSAFEPEHEAIAAEVALLRRHYPASVAWGLTHRHWILLSRTRGYGLHLRLHALFRAATRLLEPRFQLNHVFGSAGDWFYLAGPRRRPTVLTMAALSQPVEQALLERVDAFVVEYPSGKDYLVRLGIEPGRVRLILPPVDLARFTPGPAPAGPFTVLFASSPDRDDWLEARGIPELLDAAVRRPRMRFRFLWRPWGNSEARMRRLIAERGLQNVELCVGCWENMSRQYQEAHVTAAPFTDPQRCKPAPNSLVESLACGRPVLVTPTVGLADLVAPAAAVVPGASGEAIAEGLDRLEADWDRLSHSARRLAELWFGQQTFLTSYQRLYQHLLSN